MGLFKRALMGITLLCALSVGLAAQTTLTVWDFKYANNDAAAKALKDLDVLFEAAHSGVKINHVGYAADAYYPAIQAAVTAKKGPDVAMFHADARLQQYASSLLSLDKDAADVIPQFTAPSIVIVSSPAKAGGSLKLLPMNSQGIGIYYNKALFKKAGLDPEQPPKGAAEFLAACAKLKAAGIVPIVTGKDYTFDFLLRALVADIVGPNTDGLAAKPDFFGTPQFKDAIAFIQTLVSKGYIEKEGLSRPYFMDAINVFQKGGGGFFIGLLSDVANWKSFSDTLGITNLGYFPTVNLDSFKLKDQQSMQPAGIGVGIMSWTAQKQLALEYVKYLTTGSGAGRFATATGAVSPNTMIDTSRIPYPILPTIIGYLKKSGSQDFTNFAQAKFLDQAYKLFDQAFVAQSLSADGLISGLKAAYSAQ